MVLGAPLGEILPERSVEDLVERDGGLPGPERRPLYAIRCATSAWRADGSRRPPGGREGSTWSARARRRSARRAGSANIVAIGLRSRAVGSVMVARSYSSTISSPTSSTTSTNSPPRYISRVRSQPSVLGALGSSGGATAVLMV